MRMFDSRRYDGRRSLCARRLKGVAAFGDTPAIVLTFANEMRCLPQVLAIVADPQLIRLLVISDTPWIAQTYRPKSRPRTRHLDERIVAGTLYCFPSAGRSTSIRIIEPLMVSRSWPVRFVSESEVPSPRTHTTCHRARTPGRHHCVHWRAIQ